MKSKQEWSSKTNRKARLTLYTLSSLGFIHIFEPLHRRQIFVQAFFLQSSRVSESAFQVSFVLGLQFCFTAFYRLHLRRTFKSSLSVSVPVPVPFHGIRNESLSVPVQVPPFVSLALPLPQSIPVPAPRPVFVGVPVPLSLPGLPPLSVPLSVVLIPVTLRKPISAIK